MVSLKFIIVGSSVYLVSTTWQAAFVLARVLDSNNSYDFCS
jgi:hypothetical protein